MEPRSIQVLKMPGQFFAFCPLLWQLKQQTIEKKKTNNKVYIACLMM